MMKRKIYFCFLKISKNKKSNVRSISVDITCSLIFELIKNQKNKIIVDKNTKEMDIIIMIKK
jgi:ribulose kinase